MFPLSTRLSKRSRVALASAAAAASLAGCQTDAVGPRAESLRTSADVAPTAAPGEVIPGQYVVLFRAGRVLAGVTDPMSAGPAVAADLATASAHLAADKVARAGGVLRRTYGHAVQGFAAALSDSAASALRADPDVAVVEADRVVRATAGGVESSAPWGLDRIDQVSGPLDGLYHYANTGSGTSVYIVDTGINLTHVEFGGRAVTGTDFVTAGGTAVDCNGHGSHVAGIVGGATYGVAKGARLVAVRVLDCSGSGSESNVIAALDWVAQQRSAAPTTPAVVNMSLSGGAAAALDSAVQRTVAAGVTIVVAAGNATTDACTVSPARAPSAIAVAATDASDNFAGFSNYGTCVKIAGPGVSILSAYTGSTTATATLSGTSMASPHVAGAAALYLAANPTATPAQVTAALTSNAASGKIQGLPANTPSRLLYTGFLLGAALPTGPIVNGVPLPNVCLDVQGGTATAPALPASLQAWQCHGGANQQFTLQPNGTITVYGGQLCVDVWRARANDGDSVVVWPCNGGANQKWVYTAAGQLQTAVNGKCLDLWLARGENGAPIKIWPCNGGPNQRWTLPTAAVASATPALVPAAAAPIARARRAG